MKTIIAKNRCERTMGPYRVIAYGLLFIINYTMLLLILITLRVFMRHNTVFCLSLTFVP